MADFVAGNSGKITYFQVTYTIKDENTLKSINNRYPKFILIIESKK